MDAADPYLENATRFARANPPPEAPANGSRGAAGPSTQLRRLVGSRRRAGRVHAHRRLAEDRMQKETNFARTACACSPTSWYAWLSPWLLGESATDRHLVPLGDPQRKRIIVGHNVRGTDRARIVEEYDLQQSNNFFLDTMHPPPRCRQRHVPETARPTWMLKRTRKSRELRDEISQSGELHRTGAPPAIRVDSERGGGRYLLGW